MDLASPCGPPVKTRLRFFLLEAESVSQKMKRGWPTEAPTENLPVDTVFFGGFTLAPQPALPPSYFGVFTEAPGAASSTDNDGLWTNSFGLAVFVAAHISYATSVRGYRDSSAVEGGGTRGGPAPGFDDSVGQWELQERPVSSGGPSCHSAPVLMQHCCYVSPTSPPPQSLLNTFKLI
ncbi:unnamed protein product [Pleuronectes platessa]|uniref:Uncharacterized protein n=1 Tax=Pleuronectes platessa TaxID=8262 RepID=A0A9N7UP48_PLEPL|nr:unnamed protein product [Pleuronectes platessa]